jgi:ketosteroid isomerase-like protein
MTAAQITHRSQPVDDIEAIKQLKARYFRTLDTKDWVTFRAIFTDDVVLDTTASGGNLIHGADEFLVFLQDALGEVVSVHHGHMPEIELTSPTQAIGTWALEDLLRWPDGSELRGYGHYHEVYEKKADTWQIKSSTLTRLRMDFTGAPTA